MILIISNKLDPHVDRVVSLLSKRGSSFERLNTEDFPNEIEIDWLVSEGEKGGELKFPLQNRVCLSQIKSCWYRRPTPSNISHDLLTPQTREFAQNESTAFLKSLWVFLSDRFWMNYPLKIRNAESKINNLRLASCLGLYIPRTLITTNPNSAKKFFNDCNGNVITKVMGSGQIEYFKDHYFIYTHKITFSDLPELRNVSYAPTLFQEYIPKSTEIRVTVIGEQVFACEIYSQDSQQTKDDWRRYDFENVRHLVHNLPPKINTLCLELVSKLELNFATIDLILTPDNQYVFLELNPNGQWLWIENLTGLPIGEAITDLLVKHDQ